MGTNQSSPSSSGRSRAYSGSDLPSSSAGLAVRYVYGAAPDGSAGAASASAHRPGSAGASGSATAAARPQSAINIPSSGAFGSQGSGGSSPEEGAGDRNGSSAGHGGPRLLIGSLPSHLSPHLFGAVAWRVWKRLLVRIPVCRGPLSKVPSPHAAPPGACHGCLLLTKGDS
ncbi:E3 ubiquitin-protein ligase znrf2 isoform X2 [Denticeps clupeoides]|uniref:E3 ubiquitin-protein ligase znrf2 isoform X2 n=1 Tax=Denticeps clupeoides TaxID=299321 RepID=UPI0010A46701|nr:E3 ubiquitin-protein ligase znrf2-like isoform X2 [Denticeps clupeoides]